MCLFSANLICYDGWRRVYWPPEITPPFLYGVDTNGLELSCPVEAGNSSMTVRQAGGRFKHRWSPSPSSQLQRVVGRPHSHECCLPLRILYNAATRLILGTCFM